MLSVMFFSVAYLQAAVQNNMYLCKNKNKTKPVVKSKKITNSI